MVKKQITMTPEDYLASKQIILPIPQGIVNLVSMKDALKAVKMAKGENVRRFEPMNGIARIQVKDLSHMTEEEAIAYIDSLGAFGYNTSSLRNEYKRTKHITI